MLYRMTATDLLRWKYLVIVLFQQYIVTCDGIFSVPKHHETPYIEEKYTTSLTVNSTVNGTLVGKLNHLNKLAHSLVAKFTKNSIENCTAEELEKLQNDMNSLHRELEEFHFIESKKDKLEMSTNKTTNLYLDTINTIIKFNEIVTKLI
jgi:hypothetical protein